MYDWLRDRGPSPLPSVFAHVSHGLHRRLAHEVIHVPLLHGARGRRAPSHVRNSLSVRFPGLGNCEGRGKARKWILETMKKIIGNGSQNCIVCQNENWRMKRGKDRKKVWDVEIGKSAPRKEKNQVEIAKGKGRENTALATERITSSTHLKRLEPRAF